MQLLNNDFFLELKSAALTEVQKVLQKNQRLFREALSTHASDELLHGSKVVLNNIYNSPLASIEDTIRPDISIRPSISSATW